MALAARKIFTLQKLIRCSIPQVQSSRSAGGHWNDDWKPGPYPKTEAERLAAARRYGLLPEDYEPYPDDGMGHGDYPMLPIVSAESRDPFENFDYPAHRRNFGEPLHVHFDKYGLDRVKHEHTSPVPAHMQFISFFSLVGTIFLLSYLCEDYYPREQKPKQFPFKGETHYTFEPAQ